MKIYVLTEDTSREGFEHEFGMSLVIETCNNRVLFDTGSTDVFLRNAPKLGIDIASITACVISHGHSDHGGGISAFLRTNATAPVFVSKNAFLEHFSPQGNAIGLDPSLQENSQIVRVENEMKINDELFLFNSNNADTPYASQSAGMLEKINGEMQQDTFLHEQYLVVTDGSARILLSGCSHKGILNIMHFAKDMQITYVVGGFHLKNLITDANSELERIATELNAMQCSFFTCHCTGIPQYNTLKRIMGSKLTYIASGDILEF